MSGGTRQGESGHGGAHGAARVRCVLWMPRGVAPPSELELELDRKGIAHVASDNAHGAMAALCAGSGRSERPCEASVGSDRALTLRVIVLVEPEMLLDARALLDAIDRYAPDAARWVFRRSANPMLRALVENDVPSAERRTGGVFGPVFGAARTGGLTLPKPERRPNAGDGAPTGLRGSSSGAGRPALRLTDDPPVQKMGEKVNGRTHGEDDGLGDPVMDGGPADGTGGASGVLTDEELSMLLGDGPDGASGAGPAKGSGGR